MSALTNTKQSMIRNFTEGNLSKHLITFAFPMLLANLMMVLLNSVNLVVVGQRLGGIGTSAVAIGSSVSLFVSAFSNGFCSAAQILIAQMVGANEKHRISRFVATACGFLFVFSMALMLILLPLTGTILELLNTPAEAYEGAFSYSLISLLTVVPMFAYHLISAIVRGMGDSRHPFWFIFIACGSSIVMCIVFVPVFDMGVGGAALASLLAQIISVAFSIRFLIKKKDAFELGIRFRDFVHWNREDLGDLIKLGVPMALNNSAIQIAGMTVSAMTNDYGVAVSAFEGIRSNLNTTVNLVMNAVAAAGAMVVGQNLVAGKVARVNKTLVIVAGFTLTITAVFCGAFLLFPRALFGLFNRDADVLAIVPSYLPILVLDFVALGLRPVTRAIIDGSGNRKINLVNALLDAVVARIGFAFLFGVHLAMGYYGFWLGAALAAYVPILVGVVFYLTGVWKKAIKVQ